MSHTHDHVHTDRPLKYVLKDELHYQTNIFGFQYENDKMCIKPNGEVTLKPGCQSDGNTPKVNVFGLGTYGVPDGLMQPDGLPTTGRAFFLHDILLDHHHRIGIPTKVIHEAYCQEIRASKFWLRKLYCFAVTHFGPKH